MTIFNFPRRVPIQRRGEGETSKVEYDEVIYDYQSDRYLTRHQQEEIKKLKMELEQKKIDKRNKLKNIIGYYYKRI